MHQQQPRHLANGDGGAVADRDSKAAQLPGSVGGQAVCCTTTRLARGETPVASPIAAERQCQGDRAPTPPARTLRPSTRLCTRMTALSASDTEPAPATRKPRRRGGGAGRHFGPRPVDDPRSARLEIRCTPALRAKTVTGAGEAGLSLAGYVCKRLGEAPGPRVHRKPSEATKVLAQILAQLGWRGSNLNQIAHRFNMLDIPPPAELGAAIAEHRACVDAIMRALEQGLDGRDYH
jgi:Mobilization protein NikA